ncbi:hypothetical protein EXIGLDRAFT_726579, partial [Exidia glandulosa HHB12029]
NGIDDVKTLLREERVTVQSLASSFERLSRRIEVAGAPFYFFDDSGHLTFCKFLLLSPNFAKSSDLDLSQDTYMTVSMVPSLGTIAPYVANYRNGPVHIPSERVLGLELDVLFTRRHIRRPRVAVEFGCFLYSDSSSFGAKMVLLSPAYLTLDGIVLELTSLLSRKLSNLLTTRECLRDETGGRATRRLWTLMWQFDVLHDIWDELELPPEKCRGQVFHDLCNWTSRHTIGEDE